MKHNYKKEATIGNYTIGIRDNYSVEVLIDGKVYDGMVMPLLRDEIAPQVGLKVDPKWNTQDLGRKLVDCINERVGEDLNKNKMRKKKFTIEVFTRYSHILELTTLDSKKLDVGSAELRDTIIAREVVLDHALDDEWDGIFHLTVKDSDGLIVYEYEGDDYSEFFYDYDDDEYDHIPEIDAVVEKKFLEDRKQDFAPGYYLLFDHHMKGMMDSFVIEDSEFHPEKFKFVFMGKFVGLLADQWTDMHHVMYDGKFIEPEIDYYWEWNETGYVPYIVERKSEGYWIVLEECDADLISECRSW